MKQNNSTIADFRLVNVIKSHLGPRERKIVSTAAGLLFAKGISLLTLIATVPMTLHYLGVARFGVWMTLTSLTTLFSTADFGVGAGIMTELAKATGRGDRLLARKVVSNGFATLSLLALGLMLVVVVAFFTVDWGKMFGVPGGSDASDVGLSVLIFMLCSLLTIPGMLGQRMLMGLQKGHMSGVWMSLGSLSSLVMLFVAIHLGGTISALITAFVGAPLIVMILCTFHTVGSERLWPTLHDLDMAEVRRTIAVGLRFFVIAITYAVVFTTDNLIIGRILGPKAVAVYSIADRMFQVIAIGLTMINAPLWPAYADAHARGDKAWILRTFKLSIVTNLAVGAALAVVLVALRGWLAGHWVGAALVPSLILSICVGARRVVEAVHNACNNLMNALDRISVQIIWGVLMIVPAVGLRFLLIEWLGVAGSALAVIITVVTVGFVPVVVALRGGALAATTEPSAGA